MFILTLKLKNQAARRESNHIVSRSPVFCSTTELLDKSTTLFPPVNRCLPYYASCYRYVLVV